MSKYFDFSDEADHAAFIEDLSKEIVGRPGGSGGVGLAPGQDDTQTHTHADTLRLRYSFSG